MSRTQKSKRRHVARNAALVILSLIIMLFILEIVFRTTHLFGARISWREPDPLMGWRSTPNSTYWYIKENNHPVIGRNNSFGWRDKERTLVKPENTYRIAVLGDSFVEALEVEFDSTFLAIAERQLNATSDTHIEVMNFGRIGMTQTEEYILLQEEVVRFAPDMITVLFWPQNDIADVHPRTAINQLRPFYQMSADGGLILDTSFAEKRQYKLKKALHPFKQHSALLSLLLERYGVLRWRMRESQLSNAKTTPTSLTGYLSLCTAQPEPIYAENYQLNKLLIKAMAEYCSDRNIRFMLIGATTVYKTEDLAQKLEINPTFNADFFDEDLSAHTDSLHAEYLGLHQKFAGYYQETGRSLTWSHWNYAGHRVVAAEFSRKVQQVTPDIFQ
ncbi:MAG: hypothetical protein ABIA59_08750 [Candidatus Latescibacterota bacterium]